MVGREKNIRTENIKNGRRNKHKWYEMVRSKKVQEKEKKWTQKQMNKQTEQTVW